MNTIDILKAARAKIEKPENWTQGDFAADIRGNGCDWDALDACSWCIRGAVSAVAGCLIDERMGELLPLTDALEVPDHSDDPIANFNDADSTTHADVLALFDRAIAAEEAKAVQS